MNENVLIFLKLLNYFSAVWKTKNSIVQVYETHKQNNQKQKGNWIV